jgi:hypothetical protein
MMKKKKRNEEKIFLFVTKIYDVLIKKKNQIFKDSDKNEILLAK